MSFRNFLATLFVACSVFPSSPAQQTSQCVSTVTGDLDIVPFTSTVFKNTRNLRVWLPPGYHDAANASKTYPVLYMFDGQLLFDRCTGPGGQFELHVDETLTDLIAKHTVQPIIVVGIDNAGADRDREYQPYFNPTLPVDDPSTLEGNRIPVFLAKDVLPYVTSHYRVAKGPENTGIGGASAGAVAALLSLLNRPDLFGLGLLESTSLHLGNGRLMRETSPILKGPIRVSIGVGTAELPPDLEPALRLPDFDAGFVQLTQTLASNFKNALMNHPAVKLTIQPGGRHHPDDWAKRFPEAVEFLYPPVRP